MDYFIKIKAGNYAVCVTVQTFYTIGSLEFFFFFFLSLIIALFIGWLVGFHGISTFVGYLMPNPFL